MCESDGLADSPGGECEPVIVSDCMRMSGCVLILWRFEQITRMLG